MRIPRGRRRPPPSLHHLLLLAALCSSALKTAAAAPSTGGTGEGGGGLASVTGSIMDTKDAIPAKDISTKEPVGGVIALKESMKYFDADFFNDSKLREMENGAKEFNVPAFRENRRLVAIKDGGLHDPSVLVFQSSWSSKSKVKESETFDYPQASMIQRPSNDEDIAFMSIIELGELIRTKKITSRELTDVFLRRLKRYGAVLESVITYTEDLAYKQAKEADDLLEQGKYLGPLHGIPYGLKDIIAVPQYNTTWGSKTFKNQVIDMEAFVYKRLKSAGAILVAKLVTGSLAYDDIWFGGRTRNPWNIEEFSTGSSAGPTASTSAGMVPFAIGSETAGSITYPAARCGVTALRPSFGTIARTGVMSLSESLDKLGPFCRSATDCAIVLDAIRGADAGDPSSREIALEDPFHVDITKFTVGYLDSAEMEVVKVLSAKGAKLVPFKLNYTVESVQSILNITMDVDMLAHFDNWQREGHDDEYEAQDQWPVELRRARLVPAVDYVQAQRARGRLIREVQESFTVDAFIGNVTDWELVCLGNLVGLPIVVVPTGFKSIEHPPKGNTRRRTTVTTGIYAPPDHDHIALALAMAYQSVTDHHKQRPPIDAN
ncbi:Glutamyl-tRNA(Gln) amidotransferase subunit A [Triticum urartu]|uniref:Glutamyl-tRNA(Gln) amidotransferase subunit A n=1 Tax=Triticum urartu TaxID=4572 RepID=M7ZFM4_TRIUA|nr:glutamyl-tRNA(Gln) amidotransferase subunit A isoform X2 [Triticum urartu]EMS51195.1 Glutamyl-tRNA(Gln) amidotransferase subunit A [Triticum urartu]